MIIFFTLLTIFFQLHSEREAVPDAPAVYFVRPTPENIQRIVEDCSQQVWPLATTLLLYPLA